MKFTGIVRKKREVFILLMLTYFFTALHYPAPSLQEVNAYYLKSIACRGDGELPIEDVYDY